MRFLSVCSGMEAASVAFEPLGWRAGAFSEVDPACCDLLAHHYPDVPNLGDITAGDFIDRARGYGPYGLVCGGTPCQAFSVAGRREGLGDDRGNLTLRFVEICNGLDPAWIIWENVPGVLSDKTNAFGCLLAGLVGADAPLVSPQERGRWTSAGYVTGPKRIIAWRVLDAQYFGLAQRRRRVYVVGVRAGAGADPGQVLFEPESVRRDTAPSREKGEEVAGSIGGGTGERGWPAEVASTLNAHYGDKWGLEDQHALGGASLFVPAVPAVCYPIDTRNATRRPDSAAGCGESREGDPSFTVTSGPIPAICFDTTQITSKTNRSNPQFGDPCHTLAKGAQPPAIAFDNRMGLDGELCQTVRANSHGALPMIQQAMAVRRLTPVECERLQGFPDNYTLIPRRNGKPMADGPRYKMIGNSWPVPVVRWIGERIDMNADK